MKKFAVWFHYFLINLLTYHELPCWINSGGYEWFNCIEKCYAFDCNWHIRYSRYKGGEVIDLMYVESHYKYIAYMKMVIELLRNSDKLSYGIDYV